jgi:hypothetical protein
MVSERQCSPHKRIIHPVRTKSEELGSAICPFYGTLIIAQPEVVV